MTQLRRVESRAAHHIIGRFNDHVAHMLLYTCARGEHSFFTGNALHEAFVNASEEVGDGSRNIFAALQLRWATGLPPL